MRVFWQYLSLVLHDKIIIVVGIYENRRSDSYRYTKYMILRRNIENHKIKTTTISHLTATQIVFVLQHVYARYKSGDSFERRCVRDALL